VSWLKGGGIVIALPTRVFKIAKFLRIKASFAYGCIRVRPLVGQFLSGRGTTQQIAYHKRRRRWPTKYALQAEEVAILQVTPLITAIVDGVSPTTRRSKMG